MILDVVEGFLNLDFENRFRDHFIVKWEYLVGFMSYLKTVHNIDVVSKQHTFETLYSQKYTVEFRTFVLFASKISRPFVFVLWPLVTRD